MKKIAIDKNSIMINDKPVVLLASSFFYFRIPKEKWEQRLILLKLAGYNTVDVYFPWNYHESMPGKWDFTGQRDIDSFLRLVKKHDMYIIARPGPYICSEWDGGGIPPWLYSKNIPMRQDKSEFLDELFVWYDKIMPILKTHQLTQNGNIIMLQLENELDYFICESPSTYIEKLSIKARSFGIDVPLFYCCAQNDLGRSGAPQKDAFATFNIYGAANDLPIEERALYLRNMVKHQNVPLMVSETNRSHSFLKRLLCCGAKLLSPYNQTAGSTMEFYNGISNWGKLGHPVSYMATNYDFESMISSSGMIGNEFLYARLLSGLLTTFQSLAQASPTTEKAIRIDGDWSMLPSIKGEGYRFFPLSNLKEEKDVIIAEIGEWQVEFQMDQLYTAMVPLDIQLDKFDGNGTMLFSNYEIAFSEKVEGKYNIILYGNGNWHAAFKDEKNKACEYKMEQGKEIEINGVVFKLMNYYDAAQLGTEFLPPFSEKNFPQKQIGELKLSALQDFDFETEKYSESPIDFLEKLGQYNGFAAYKTNLDKGEVLLHDTADLLEISKENVFDDFIYSPGGTQRITASAGTYRFLTEIWGHSNFDDVRLPVLNMGSMKGIGKITQIKREQDISFNWKFRLLGENYAETPKLSYNNYDTIINIDGYNQGLSPISGTYNKLLELPDNYNSFTIHFAEADCLIKVFVNGNFVKKVCPADPYVDISQYVQPGSSVDIGLHIWRRFFSDQVGKTMLISGNFLKSCNYSKALLPAVNDNSVNFELPISMNYGERKSFVLSVPETNNSDIEIICDTKDVKLTFVQDGFVIARILPQNGAMPEVKGGNPNLVYIPCEWLADNKNVTVYCQAIGRNAVLKGLSICRVTQPLKNE